MCCTWPLVRLPQFYQRESAGHFHKKKRQHRRSMVPLDQGLRHAGEFFYRALRSGAAEKHRKRKKGHRRKNNEARPPKVLALTAERNDKQSQSDNCADDRKMVEEEMEFRKIH